MAQDPKAFMASLMQHLGYDLPPDDSPVWDDVLEPEDEPRHSAGPTVAQLRALNATVYKVWTAGVTGVGEGGCAGNARVVLT